MQPAYYIGTMSGTSADGLDIAIVEIPNQHSIQLVHSYFRAYPEAIRSKILQLQTLSLDELLGTFKAELDLLDLELIDFYSSSISKCLSEAQLSPDAITAIGNHGQTIIHQPNSSSPISLQICNGQQLASNCSIPVINNFRQADIQHGGQGAPLMPAFHAAIFDNLRPCAIVNIGGISNSTLLLKDTTIGFDNGPGNTLIDAWISKHRNYRFDENGEWGRSGKIIPALKKELLKEPYFANTPPKSTGQDLFNLQWLEEKLALLNPSSKEDVQATLHDLTAQIIISDIKQYGPSIKEIFCCGGGVKNEFLMERMKFHADQQFKIQTTKELGVEIDWVEAIGFAWLAFCRLHNLNSNIPSVTGASKSLVLGEVSLP